MVQCQKPKTTQTKMISQGNSIQLHTLITLTTDNFIFQSPILTLIYKIFQVQNPFAKAPEFFQQINPIYWEEN